MFGSRRVITVNSSVYNLAGEISKRPNFLKVLMTEQALYKTHESYAKAITDSYVSGPGVKLRNLVPFALRKDYYSLTNQSKASVASLGSLSSETVDEVLENLFGYPILLMRQEIGGADIGWWAYKYLAENHPTRADEIFETSVGVTGFLEIDFFHLETDTVPYETMVTDIDVATAAMSGDYLYVSFRREYETLVMPEPEEPEDPEEPEEPEEPVEPEVPDLVLYPLQVFIYKRGSGTAVLDDLFDSSEEEGHCLPIVPIKYDSNPGRSPDIKYIDRDSEGDDAVLYKASKRLLARVGDIGTYDGIIKTMKSISDHEKINYGFVVHAVPVNSSSNSAKKYLFHFFDTFGAALGGGVYENYEILVELAKSSIENRNLWQEVHRSHQWQHPLWGTPAPKVYAYPIPPTFSFAFNLHTSSGVMLNYIVKWNNLKILTGSGRLGDMKAGEVITTMVSSPPVVSYPTATGGYAGHNSPTLNFTGAGSKFRITYQRTDDYWEEITVYGLHSVNTIHRGRGEILRVQDAFNEEEESSFIIPLHTLPLREMGMVDVTQFSTSCTYLMLNYYTETKKKWYQTGLFKFVVIVAAVALTVFTAGKGLPVAIKMLAAASAVGAVALAIAIAKLALTAIAALIVSRLIIKVSVELLGDVWGTIIGTIAAMAVMYTAGSYINNSNIAFMDFFSAQYLLDSSFAIVANLSSMIEAKTNSFIANAQMEMDAILQYTNEVASMFNEEFNPEGLQNARKHLLNMSSSYLMNLPEVFLHRTLLTGSDIVNLSLGALESSLDVSLPTL